MHIFFLLFFLLFSTYYFLIPLIFLFENFISSNEIFENEVYYLTLINIPNYFIQYNFASLILLFLVFYLLYKKFFFIKNIKKIKIHKHTYNLVIIICILFLLKDIFYLIKYYLDNEIINRHYLYLELINNRRTHINLLIIISVINFKENKIFSYLSYLLIFIYSILSLSRIDLFFLFFCHISTNISFNKKNFYKVSLILIAIISFIILYRFIISNQSLYFIFIEPLHLMISSIIFFKNLLSIDLNYLLLKNVNFFLKDFFYFPINIDNFFINPLIPSYSIRGIDSLLSFFFVFLIYFYILKLLFKSFYINKYFLNCFFAYSLISLFRGNFVHNLNFLIKVYILIIVLSWVIKKMQQFRLRVV
jgi:hypothetical protein